MLNPFWLSGSRSTHFDLPAAESHPLPSCPDSPNCVRISISHDQPEPTTWNAVSRAIRKMNPSDLRESADKKRIDAVFQVFFFKDDFTLQLERKTAMTLIHIRSSSREGYSDLGVNRRRVKRFLKLVGNNF